MLFRNLSILTLIAATNSMYASDDDNAKTYLAYHLYNHDDNKKSIESTDINKTSDTVRKLTLALDQKHNSNQNNIELTINGQVIKITHDNVKVVLLPTKKKIMDGSDAEAAVLDELLATACPHGINASLDPMQHKHGLAKTEVSVSLSPNKH